MKKVIILAVAVLAVTCGSAFAASTHQEWNFDNAPVDPPVAGVYTVAADVSDNAYGTPTADIWGYDGSVPFAYAPTALGRSGVWTGDPIMFELTIPNTPETGGVKTVWMEITASYVDRLTPSITAYDASGSGQYTITELGMTKTDILDDTLTDTLWDTILIGWEITPNPQSEVITDIAFIGTGGFVDKIVVDTTCTVPVPGALMLGGLGTALVGFIKRRKAI